MLLIGVDYHPSFQTIAFFVEETGEYAEQELNHSDGQAEKFYRDLKQRGIRVRVGMEATGYARWFERLLAELGFELWIGDPAEIKAKRVKKQKFDREDARLLLRLVRENNFPQIWVPGPENRDLRQLLWHRHRLVQMRTRIMNQLHALAMNEGYRWKKKLFSEQGREVLEKLSLAPWASRRRQELLELLDRRSPSAPNILMMDGSEPRLMMPASRKGKGRKAKSHYPVPISADLAERLAAMDRSANAPLLTRPGGKPWRRSNQAYPFRRVASACGQDPAEVTMYALRHSSIVRQLLAGVPVRIVAAGHDTSVAMIERNYSRYITDHADALVRGAMLDLMPRDKPKLALIG